MTTTTIVKAECLRCGKVTTDAWMLEAMNDLDPTCPTCGVHHVRWTLSDGSTAVTAECVRCGEPADNVAIDLELGRTTATPDGPMHKGCVS